MRKLSPSCQRVIIYLFGICTANCISCALRRGNIRQMKYSIKGKDDAFDVFVTSVNNSKHRHRLIKEAYSWQIKVTNKPKEERSASDQKQAPKPEKLAQTRPDGSLSDLGKKRNVVFLSVKIAVRVCYLRRQPVHSTIVLLPECFRVLTVGPITVGADRDDDANTIEDQCALYEGKNRHGMTI